MTTIVAKHQHEIPSWYKSLCYKWGESWVSDLYHPSFESWVLREYGIKVQYNTDADTTMITYDEKEIFERLVTS